MMNVFQLADNDQAVFYLGQIFGNVGAALQGTGPALLGKMFKVFDTILLAVAVIVVTYVSVVGVMKTAAEGEVLGKGWSTLWVPLRTVFGVALLMPTTSGYCAAQVIIMWFIVQGVGAADMVWNAAINYIGAGGSIMTPVPPPPTDVTGAVGARWQILTRDLICQAAVTKIYADDASAFAHSVPTDNGYTFGRKDFPTECGIVNWPNDTTSTTGQAAKGMSAALTSAYQTALPTLEIIADYYASQALGDPNCWTPCTPNPNDPNQDNCNIVGKWVSINLTPTCILNSPGVPITHDPQTYNNGTQSESLQTNSGLDAWNKVLTYTGSNFLLDITKLFSGYANNYAVNAAELEQTNVQGTNITDFSGSQVTASMNDSLKKAEANGWLFAGAFYYYIAKYSNTVQGDYTDFVLTPQINPPNLNLSDFDSGTDKGVASLDIYYASYTLAWQASMAMEQTNSITGGIQVKSSGHGGGPAATLVTATDNVAKQWINNIAPTTGNPIVKVQGFGVGLLVAAEVLIGVFFGVTLALGIASTVVVFMGNTVNFAQGVAASTLSFLTPAVFFIVAYMITIGGFLGVYVPLIPYIIFTLGTIGWFILAIEAMVAGPIVAIGLLSPGGQHEIFSRAEASIMLTLSLMLRPTLMIFGMFAAMLLSVVVVGFIHAAIYNVLATINGSPGLIETLLYIVVYTGLIIIALNKCFDLIHLVPDRVLHWIGHQGAGLGMEREGLEQVRGKVGAGSEAAVGSAKGFGGAAQGAADKTSKQSMEGSSPQEYAQEAQIKSQKDLEANAAGRGRGGLGKR